MLSAEVEALVVRGQYAPDSFVMRMFREVSRTFPEKGMWSFDGFPRTPAQVAPFVEVCREHHRRMFAIELLVPDEVMDQRRAARLEAERRIDDAADVSRERLRIYHDGRKDLEAALRFSGVVVIPVLGDADPETVATRVRAGLSQREELADQMRKVFTPSPST